MTNLGSTNWTGCFGSILVNPLLDAFLVEAFMTTVKLLTDKILWILTWHSNTEYWLWADWTFVIFEVACGLFDALLQCFNMNQMIWIGDWLLWIGKLLHNLTKFFHIVQSNSCIFIQIFIFAKFLHFFFVSRDYNLKVVLL